MKCNLMRIVQRLSSLGWFLAFFISGLALTLWLGSVIQFHAISNDFWNILYYGRKMSLYEPVSLYNGFYPFGYALLIGQLPLTYVMPLAYGINALLAGLYVAAAAGLVFCSNSKTAAAVAFLAALAAPYVFKSANTLSPDMGSLAFTAFAIFLMWRGQLNGEAKKMGKLLASLSGLSLGMAFLWRSHAVVASVAVLLAYAVFGTRQRWGDLKYMGIAFLALLMAQVAVNLVSGHGAFETAQAFNIHKFFYGVTTVLPPTPAEIAKFSLLDEVLQNPERALTAYLLPLQYHLSFIWAPLALFLIAPRGKFARFGLFSITYILLYSIPVSLGDSPRAPILLMAVYIPSVALIPAAWNEQAPKVFKQAWVPRLVLILFLGACAWNYYGWVQYDINLIERANDERRTLAFIEKTLIAHGMKSPDEVFADRHDFYTPHTMPYRARWIGNWAQDWVWGYADEYPALPGDTWQAFSAACSAQGIRYLVLSPNSRYRGEIFPPIYERSVDLDRLGLKYLGQRGKIRLFEFK